MRTFPFYVVDSFTDTPFQGNPAGVFFDDAGTLTPEEMHRLAGEVSLESAFVRPGDGDADYRLRYFTREIEVPFCGHDTVATAVVLAATGRVSIPGTVRFVNNVGPVPVSLRTNDAGRVEAMLHQSPARVLPPVDEGMVARIATALGIPETEIAATGLPVQWATTGSGWVYVPVASRTAVDSTPTDFPAITALSRELDSHGFYVFTLERRDTAGISVWSRCYAPIAGLNEDPVTGSASGGLGGYLNANGLLTFTGPALSGGASQEIIARQGFAGGRGGTARIVVKRAGDAVTGIDVRGTATLLASGTFTLP